MFGTISGLFLLLLSLPNLGPSIRAAGPDGRSGIFTAEELTCVKHLSHTACDWRGTFTDGTTTVHGVSLYGSSKNSLRPGQRTAAVDTGRRARVYPPGGSREWIPTTALAVTGLTLILWSAGLTRRPSAYPTRAFGR